MTVGYAVSMRWRVRLGCGACYAVFDTVIDGKPCPGGGPHVHFPTEGLLEMWGSAHREPGLIVIGPIPGGARGD